MAKLHKTHNSVEEAFGRTLPAIVRIEIPLVVGIVSRLFLLRFGCSY